MKRPACFLLAAVLILAHATSANATITTKTTVTDNVLATYNFGSLDPKVYQQAITQLSADSVPKTIIQYLKQKNETNVQYGLPAQPWILDNATNSINTSFFLSGSDIVSFTINQTTFKRTYQVKTDWIKFKITLTGNFSIDFNQLLTTSVSSWQRINYTDDKGVTHPALYNENAQTGTMNVTSTIILPESAMNIRFQESTVIFDLPPILQDELLDSPFIILAALVVALIVILIYRKTR
jgi:hypothetical protein